MNSILNNAIVAKFPDLSIADVSKLVDAVKNRMISMGADPSTVSTRILREIMVLDDWR